MRKLSQAQMREESFKKCCTGYKLDHIQWFLRDTSKD